MAKFLTADEILAAEDSAIEVVDVPEWGGSVHMKPLTGEQRDKFEMMLMNWREKNKDVANIRAILVGWSLCDADGNPLMNGRQVQLLGKKNAKVLDRLYDKAREISGLTPEEIEKAEENL